MCGSRNRVYPIADVVQQADNQDMPVLEPEGGMNQEVIVHEPVISALELHLIRSIEEAARENRNLVQTVRQFQEAIAQQTELLQRRIQEHVERDRNNNQGNESGEEDEEIDVVTVDDEMSPGTSSETSDGQEETKASTSS